ncbi:hypothetical protein PT974_00468 [Cladobotryum mycophilum]|uniref:Aminoglycoside phosphotransferase domain-containing protein n=1 Tax=Cladobotryum mycophilum TaxID=491253 RepID=A0ABR0T0W4_9HYPO
MDPYIADPARIPATDRYTDVPLYGRYFPRPDDFQINPRYINSHSPESIQYWASVIGLCDDSKRLYPADESGRDVFALGSIIVKSSHLHASDDGKVTERDYSFADANEVEAIALARGVMNNVKTPDVYFAGKASSLFINMVIERLPGVALTVAIPYLSQSQRASFKQQLREILRQLHTIKPTERLLKRRHVVPDPNIVTNGRLNPREVDVLFSDDNTDTDMSFMHNDLSESNCIVDEDTIVGLIDWEMAGFFGWKTAGKSIGGSGRLRGNILRM